MSYLHVYVNLFNIYPIFQFNSKAWIVKSCLILQLCDLLHCFIQYLTSIPIWPFSLFITLCYPTPCLLRHKISLPIYVRASDVSWDDPWPDSDGGVGERNLRLGLLDRLQHLLHHQLVLFLLLRWFLLRLLLFLFQRLQKKKRILKSKLNWMHIQIRR